ncbi:MAG: SprT-like domain-containing protein [Muribaculaceae bacterium]|nr:SprT-like domain-containing protein [Muribaculaceae bacterium]
MEITQIYLNNLYEEINQEAFQGRLPDVLIQIGKATRQLGCFIYPVNINGSPMNNIHLCRIRISRAFNRTHEDYRDTLAHEMIHMYLWLAGVKETHHGPTFVRMMKDINSRCGYNISVSVRGGEAPADQRPTKSYLAVVNWRDGQRTLTRVASTYVFEFHKAVTRCPGFKSIDWYGSTDGWFRRYPAVRTLKFFKITPDDYDTRISQAIPLEMTSRELRLKS